MKNETVASGKGRFYEGNPDKVWVVKRYMCGTFYVNQEIKGQKFYDRDRRMTKRMLVSIGVLA